MHPLHQLFNSFSPITAQKWEPLFEQAEEIVIPRGKLYIHEGQYEKRVGYITQGKMRQYYTRTTGEEVTSYFYFENNLVCSYISAVDHTPSNITIEALEKTSLMVFPYALLDQLYNAEKAWERLGRKIVEYLAAGLEERMVSLLMESPEERYIRLLNSHNKLKILERIPQHYIANYLGITPISLSRIRARLQKKR